jgi:hypothetical protein
MLSGAPTEANTFNYTIPLTGGCGSVNATGTIVVEATPPPPPCNYFSTSNFNTLKDIDLPSGFTISKTTGGTSISDVEGLPAGTQLEWVDNSINLKGKPTSNLGPYIIKFTLKGGTCNDLKAEITIFVGAANPG